MGQWGDFFGGMLNPILSFLAFAGLLYTILLQRRELGLSREELRLTRVELERSSSALEDQGQSLKQQRFESAFFGMVGVLNRIIETMDIERDNRTYLGRDCFSRILDRMRWNLKHRAIGKNSQGKLVLYKPNSGSHPPYENEREKAVDFYRHFYDDHQTDLGHYFRVLYNIFKYIEESEFSGGVYPKILRAQLSNQELVILFYNCLTDAGANFAELAVRFEIFDNLDTGTLLDPSHVAFLPPKAFGKA
jgi:hypothetical protein